MTPLIEASRDILQRFKYAALQKQERFGDWQQLSAHDEDSFEPIENNEIDKQIEEKEEELEALQDRFTQSLTSKQAELYERTKSIKRDMDIFGQDAFEESKKIFEASLSEDIQRPLAEKIESIRIELLILKGRSLAKHFGVSHETLLTCPMPSDTKEEYAFTVCELLNASINLTRYNQIKRPNNLDDMGTPVSLEPIKIHPRMQDMHYALRVGKIDELIDLDAISDRLENDIAKQISTPENWKKINTRRGTSYQIEAEERNESIAFRAVNWLARLPQYKTDVAQQHILDNIIMTPGEMMALDKREREDLKIYDIPIPGHDRKRRITLSGNAATEILEALGVDTHRIKEQRANVL